jgi:hypothetical protein
VAELDNLVPRAEDEATSFDWPRLLLAGNILARSDQRTYQDAALRIATAAITLSDSEAIKDSGAVLSSKLSNFRAVALATKRGLLTADIEGRLGMALRIEAQRRQMDQSILVQSSGRWIQVNDSNSASGVRPTITSGFPRPRRQHPARRFWSCSG